MSLLSLFLSGAALVAPPELDWPDFRGPSRDGHAPADAKLPLEWNEDQNVAWKTELPGEGWSTPIVGNGRIWVTTATEEGRKMHVLALDVDSGEVVHEVLLFENEETEPKNKLNSFASPSCVLDDARVYAHFGSYGTACLDARSGEVLWQRRDIHCDHMQGPGSSPVLWRDRLILNADGGDVQYVIALDTATGETRWKTDRSFDYGELDADLRKAYSTPVLVEVGGKPRLVSSGAQATVAYDPETGEELWSVRHTGFSMSSRPVTDGKTVYLNTGFMKPNLLAVDVGGDGDVTERNIQWSYRRGVPTIPSPVLAEGRIYFTSDRGIATCLDAEQGEELWRERIDGEHCASPLYADGRIYFFDREGRTVVLESGDDYKVLATNQLDGGFMSSPAVLGDALILRTKTHVYRIEAE